MGRSTRLLKSSAAIFRSTLGSNSCKCRNAAIAALRAGGRLVVNAVTLKTEALLLAHHAALGGELIRIAIARAGAVGEKTGWRAAMPLTQWVWIKP